MPYKTVIIAFILLLPVLCNAFEPVFEPGFLVQTGSNNLDIGSYSAPAVADWNNDGKKDLLVGQFAFGRIRLYLNSGTNEAPVFTTYTFLEADGEIISVPYY